MNETDLERVRAGLAQAGLMVPSEVERELAQVYPILRDMMAGVATTGPFTIEPATTFRPIEA